MEQIGVPNGFLLCKGSFIGKILANLARIITSHNPSQVGMVFERLINIVASCDKVSQKSLAKLARLFYNNFRPSWAEVSVEIRPMMGLISSVATSSQVGTKLKSLANLARLLTEAGLLTCGQLGHKLKNGAQVDQHFRCLKDNSVQFELN